MRVSFSNPLVTRFITIPGGEDRSSMWEIAARDRVWGMHKLEQEVARIERELEKQEDCSVFNMDPAGDDVGSCDTVAEKWKEEVGWIFITLLRNGRPVRKVNFDGKPLRLEVKSNANFDRIEVEFLSGRAMLYSGFSKEKILEKVNLFSKYSLLDFHIYFDTGRSELEHMHESFPVDDEWGEPDDRSFIDLTDYEEFETEDVRYVSVEFSNSYSDDVATDGEGSDEESDEVSFSC